MNVHVLRNYVHKSNDIRVITNHDNSKVEITVNILFISIAQCKQEKRMKSNVIHSLFFIYITAKNLNVI